jgi:hypothetical protein
MGYSTTLRLCHRACRTSCAAKSMNRMPVILPPRAWPLRLGKDAAEPEQLKALLRPYPAEDMTCWPVSACVDNVKNNHPSLVQAIDDAVVTSPVATRITRTALPITSTGRLCLCGP